jgi:hypothetical protein
VSKKKCVFKTIRATCAPGALMVLRSGFGEDEIDSCGSEPSSAAAAAVVVVLVLVQVHVLVLVLGVLGALGVLGVLGVQVTVQKLCAHMHALPSRRQTEAVQKLCAHMRARLLVPFLVFWVWPPWRAPTRAPGFRCQRCPVSSQAACLVNTFCFWTG